MALSSKAVGIPRRLDESLERLEQGDLQLQVRLGESDRQFRRMIVAQQSIGRWHHPVEDDVAIWLSKRGFDLPESAFRSGPLPA